MISDASLKTPFPIEHPETIAIIPARGGSKGIPKKNIVNLCGKPLIAYSIEVALKSRSINRVIVSTDDEEIAEVAKQFGAEVPFLRPKEYAGDKSSVWDAISHTISMLGGFGNNRAFIELYPTSPFRTPALLDNLTQILIGGFRRVVTVKEVNFDRRRLFLRKKNQEVVNILEGEKQSYEWKKYYRNYPVFIGHFPKGQRRYYYHAIKNKCMLIDIDTENDLRWAEDVINHGLFDFGY